MRHLRTLIVALSTIIAVLGTAIVGAAPANAAIGTSYNVWNVRRNADSNRILHLGAWASGSLTVTANVKASRLATLATGDVVEIRLETPGGVFREIHTSGGFTTNVVGHGLSGMNESTTLKVAEPLATYNITFSGEISAASTGDVTVTPVLYVNNVRSGNAVTTDFDFAVGQWSAQATLVYTTDTYTVTANDFVVTTTTSICADLSAVSAGQALTATGTIKKDSTATGGASTATYIQDGVTSAATITNPKPTKSLVASLVNQYMYSSGDEGKVLSWANDKAIKAAGTDVAGSCFNHAATENTSGLNIWLTGLDTYVKQVSMMYNVSLMCDVVDQATSRPTTSSRNILMQQATQACYTESIQVGKTYDVRFKIFLTNGQTLIDSWTRTWTPTEPADITPPVLTGTAPDAAKYESVDNSTNAIVLGSLGTVTGNDGNAGQLVVTRQSDTTMRISQWGPTGGIAIGTGNYIDFTAPRTDAFRSGEAPWYGNSRTQVSWYGNFDKWVYSQSDAENLEFVVGTTTSNTATHATL
ncbi:MAG: hypothetical protein RL410_1427, partial [Actinomycetota bacterium]